MHHHRDVVGVATVTAAAEKKDGASAVDGDPLFRFGVRELCVHSNARAFVCVGACSGSGALVDRDLHAQSSISHLEFVVTRDNPPLSVWRGFMGPWDAHLAVSLCVFVCFPKRARSNVKVIADIQYCDIDDQYNFSKTELR